MVLSLALLLVPLQLLSQDDTRVHIIPRPVSPGASGRVASGPHAKPFRIDSNLVLIPATVTDDLDRLVTGLDKRNFEIYENHRKQQVESLWSEDSPVSVGIIFDLSGSMKDKLIKAREGIRSFLDTANRKDEFFLITFSDRPQVVSGFTGNAENLADRVAFSGAGGRTALLDAIYLGLTTMSQARYPRRALLLISDGGDNNSRYTEHELQSMIEESDVQIFSIGIFDPYAATPEEELGPQLLSDVAETTGGESFTIVDVNQLPDIAEKIGLALRNEYVLSYDPAPPPHDGKWHRIKVKLVPPKGLPRLHVSARQGYYASAE